MSVSATRHPFPKCPNGHDVTGEGAYVYQANGNRKCRICLSEEKRKPRREIRGAFDGGNA